LSGLSIFSRSLLHHGTFTILQNFEGLFALRV
jgi:hypothetical protein